MHSVFKESEGVGVEMVGGGNGGERGLNARLKIVPLLFVHEASV